MSEVRRGTYGSLLRYLARISRSAKPKYQTPLKIYKTQVHTNANSRQTVLLPTKTENTWATEFIEPMSIYLVINGQVSKANHLKVTLRTKSPPLCLLQQENWRYSSHFLHFPPTSYTNSEATPPHPRRKQLGRNKHARHRATCTRGYMYKKCWPRCSFREFYNSLQSQGVRVREGPI